MTGVLALIGGKPFAAPGGFNTTLVDESGADEVLIIPTAAAYEHPGHLVDTAIDFFGDADVRVRGLDVLSRADALDEGYAAAVRGSRCTYLVGGSAMHARSVLMHSPVWEALVAAWEDGATVAGSDAGAQILCDPMVDSRGGAFTVGLGLVTGIAVVTERNRWSEDALHRIRELSAPDLAVIGVDETTAAVRSADGTWRAVGSGTVTAHLGSEPVELSALRR